MTSPADPRTVDDAEDICGLCGEPGADRMAGGCYWPGEQRPDTPVVHDECHQEEQQRAFEALTPQQRAAFLREVSRG